MLKTFMNQHSRYTRRHFLQQASGALLGSFWITQQLARGQDLQDPPITKPNIIFILADDLGYGDLGCYGQQKIQTPHIDRLASQGMRFTQHYAGSTVCAPSRCCLLTGKHTGHATIRGNPKYCIGWDKNTQGDPPLADDDITWAQLARQAGYATACFGKWGLGRKGTPGDVNTAGFDEHFGFVDHKEAHKHYPNHLWENGKRVPLKDQSYDHDLYLDRTLNWITKHHQEPLMLFFSDTLPHAGMQVPDLGIYKNKPWPKEEKTFAAMVSRLDTAVGRIREKLEELKITNNTLIIVAGDNGPHNEQHHSDFFKGNGNLRGYKRDLYEGGIRVPMIAHWPNHIAPNSISTHPCAFWDFLPTFAELMQCPVPKGIDGISIVPTLSGNPQSEHPYLYWEFLEDEGTQAIRMGNWKAIRRHVDTINTPNIELYNLDADQSETHNIAHKHPDVIEQMTRIFQQAHKPSSQFPLTLAEKTKLQSMLNQ
jgi:arylsulfatase A-like enzyme